MYNCACCKYIVVCIQDIFSCSDVDSNCDNCINSISWDEIIKEEKVIVSITGTPGTGKTYIAKRLSVKNFKYINLNSIIKKEKLYDNYDKKAKTYDVDVKELKKLDKRFSEYKEQEIKISNKEITLTEIKKILKKQTGIIIDSHMSQYLESDLCIVVKSYIKKIYSRLKKRGYKERKIKDNLESEIFDICLEEAKKLKRNIVIIQN